VDRVFDINDTSVQKETLGYDDDSFLVYEFKNLHIFQSFVLNCSRGLAKSIYLLVTPMTIAVKL